MPLEQLCLSPQCGFASTVEGNALTYDEEVAKLALIVETAREVWKCTAATGPGEPSGAGAEKSTAAPTPLPATIVVRLPADARLTVDGASTGI